jgi:hypothetical protein
MSINLSDKGDVVNERGLLKRRHKISAQIPKIEGNPSVIGGKIILKKLDSFYFFVTI